MKLYIDTSDSEKIIVALNDKKFETSSREQRAQRLLPFIDEILQKKGTSIDKITEIEVNTGPGSFTGLRVGVSVANALGWAMDVPVNGKRVLKNGPIEPKY